MSTRQRSAAVLVVFSCLELVSAQTYVPQANRHERIIAIVPMIGAGTKDDPKRPAYVPTPAEMDRTAPGEGIIGFTAQISDDGRFAIVEFVARDRAVFKPILADRRTEVRVFEKGRAQKADIESAFRTHKKDFDLDLMGASFQ